MRYNCMPPPLHRSIQPRQTHELDARLALWLHLKIEETPAPFGDRGHVPADHVNDVLDICCAQGKRHGAQGCGSSIALSGRGSRSPQRSGWHRRGWLPADTPYPDAGLFGRASMRGPGAFTFVLEDVQHSLIESKKVSARRPSHVCRIDGMISLSGGLHHLDTE